MPKDNIAELPESLLAILQRQNELIASLAGLQFSNQTQQIEALSKTIEMFRYDEENGLTFDLWWSRYEDIFTNDANQLDDAGKVRLLLRKLDTITFTKYSNYILPKSTKEYNLNKTVLNLKSLFGLQISVFHYRYNCLQTVKNITEDFSTYAGTVNRNCENFKLSTLTSDHFKCLIFVLGLTHQSYAEVRARLLAKLQTENAEISLQNLVEECNRISNLKKDACLIENSESSSIKAIQSHRAKIQSSNKNTPSKQPRTPCWYCGNMHFVRDCSYASHACKMCSKIGHKEGYCNCPKRNQSTNKSTQSSSSSSSTYPTKSSANHSKTFKQPNWNNNKKNQRQHQSSNAVFEVCKSSQSMKSTQSQCKYVNIHINGVAAKFQIDTA